jgi:hypothetical protein
MIPYRKNSRKATARAEYARGLALDAHPKNGWVFQDPDFRDHTPNQAPVRLDRVAAEVVGDAGQAALDHWLREAARTHGEDHEIALQIARKIAGMIGVPWAEIMSEEAA